MPIPELTSTQALIIVCLIVWSLIWKGIALWKAGKNDQLVWFIFLLPINTIGILEIVYLNFFQRKKTGN